MANSNSEHTQSHTPRQCPHCEYGIGGAAQTKTYCPNCKKGLSWPASVGGASAPTGAISPAAKAPQTIPKVTPPALVSAPVSAPVVRPAPVSSSTNSASKDSAQRLTPRRSKSLWPTTFWGWAGLVVVAYLILHLLAPMLGLIVFLSHGIFFAVIFAAAAFLVWLLFAGMKG